MAHARGPTAMRELETNHNDNTNNTTTTTTTTTTTNDDDNDNDNICNDNNTNNNILTSIMPLLTRGPTAMRELETARAMGDSAPEGAHNII